MKKAHQLLVHLPHQGEAVAVAVVVLSHRLEVAAAVEGEGGVRAQSYPSAEVVVVVVSVVAQFLLAAGEVQVH